VTFDSSLSSLQEETVTIEQPTGETAARVITYGSAVTYAARIEGGYKRVTGRDGREAVSTVQVYIPDRVQIDPRSRVTLPAGFQPSRTPAIIAVQTQFGLGLDHTVVML
jgi:hypothetical protein